MSFTFENARAGDRAELLASLLAAFKTNDANHPAFDALYPDLFHDTDGAMGCHRIIRENGKIRACVGRYPMDVRIGACRVRVYGIGQVSCAPELRGGGRMTALLNDVCAEMDASDAGLAWLSGWRPRYATFGWEAVGTNLNSYIDKKTLPEAPSGWSVAELDASQLETLDALSRSASVLDETSAQTRTERMMRGGKCHRVFKASRGAEVKAMCVMQAGEGADLLEWAGDNDGIRAIIAHVLKTQKGVSVTYSPIDCAARMFWDLASGFNASLTMLRICNFKALMKSYAPILEKRIPAGKGITLTIRENNARASIGAPGGDALTLGRLEMTRLLFGPVAPSLTADLPDSLRWLDQVFPLPFILPNLSHV